MKSSNNLDNDGLGLLFTRFGWGVLVVTLLILLGLVFKAPCSALASALIFLGVIVGCIAFGGILGFLFGIPRAQKVAVAMENNGVHPAKGYYNDNTNLEEISDWLTKIILGFTLIELKSILIHIERAASSFSAALAGKCCSECSENYFVFAFGALVFYFIIGAGFTYLWTRSNLLTILEERRIDRLRRQYEEEKSRNSLLEQKFSTATKEVNKPEDQSNAPDAITQPGASDSTSSTNSFMNEIYRVYNTKRINDDEDLQKGRWGGENLKDGYKLSATYNPSRDVAGFFGVDLTVEELHGDSNKLGEVVAFFLHDSFPAEIEFVQVINGKATLQIRAFEAFVAGARTQSGVELELDLNKAKGFPKGFYY